MPLFSYGGEGGIRTLGGVLPPHSLSRRAPSASRSPLRLIISLAEEVGFEPTVLSYNGFQDRRLKPLGHSSVEHFVPFELIYVNKMQ
jgi:hypothetical protein